MRTTIELKPEHRARLLELAARRGEKGFSSVIADAIEVYLEENSGTGRLRQRALRLRGTLGHKQAERLRRHVAKLRDSWRLFRWTKKPPTKRLRCEEASNGRAKRSAWQTV